ncbi:MAG: ACP S-malonyltransferase [Candidatus Aureabacteria bacterium]|nr:ACP S-malonyltransferase [Candidatus Auribacterota bacterium]
MTDTKKIALLFPGQGGQYIGMGKELFDNFEIARNVIETAKKITGHPIDDLCFNGPVEKLKETLSSQLGILSVSIMAFEVLKHKVPSLTFDYTAGLSLGEYSAFYAAGVLGMESTFSLVHKRATHMQKACEKKSGTMVSILGLEEEIVSQVCKEINGFCAIANLNCPGQIVVSCDKSVVADVIELSKTKGAKRSIEIQVAGAFHSDYMKSAMEDFSDDVDSAVFNLDAASKIVFNVTSDTLSSGEDIKELLKKQVISPVLWEKSIRFMIESGVMHFIEIGPGKVLGGLLKRIDRKFPYSNVENIESLEKAIDQINNL